ncbi:hypothetical protein BC832DRAFT_620142 [Gaertneriomyces semiglobifer]|nr:hypothetical protein BC832DRAFT_620142 [Gaertneriomyces semiglobifer]
MAVAPTAYNGTWVIDAKRTDEYQDVLGAQNVGWILRKVIANLTLTYTMTATQNADGTWVISSINPKGDEQVFTFDAQPHSAEDKVYGPVAHSATFDPESGFVKLTTVSEKNNWKNVGTWSLEENGTVMVRHLSFESPKLTKTFKMTFTKKE